MIHESLHKKVRPLSKLTSAAFVVVLFAVAAFSQNALGEGNQQYARPFNILVLGDSILWGQGLKPKHKSWHQVKIWLEKTTGVPWSQRLKRIQERSLPERE